MDYFPEDGKWSPIVYQTNLIGTMGAGGIISTAKEVNIFVQNLFNGKMISPKNLKIMTTAKDELGMGVGVSRFNSELVYGHDGRIDGFKSIVGYFPEKKLSVALTFNCARGSMVKKLKNIIRAYQYQQKNNR